MFNSGEWGGICDSSFIGKALLADVVCRQLDFRHGTVIDAQTVEIDQDEYSYGYSYFVEEAQDGGFGSLDGERFWLNDVQCRGSEDRLTDCDLGVGFLERDSQICQADGLVRLHVACRQYDVPEALEAVTTPAAGASIRTVRHAYQCRLQDQVVCGLL